MDPDPHGSSFSWLSVPDPYWECVIADPDSGAQKLTKIYKQTLVSCLSEKLFCLRWYVYWPFTNFKYIFHVKVNFLTFKSDHDPDPHWDKKPDPDPPWNQFGSTTMLVAQKVSWPIWCGSYYKVLLHPSRFKNSPSLLLTSFWQCCGSVNTSFGSVSGEP